MILNMANLVPTRNVLCTETSPSCLVSPRFAQMSKPPFDKKIQILAVRILNFYTRI